MWRSFSHGIECDIIRLALEVRRCCNRRRGCGEDENGIGFRDKEKDYEASP
jgi:hypothetical protein